MKTAKIKNTKIQNIMLIIGVIVMFGPKFMSAPWGLNASGFQVLGIVLGSLFLWLAVAVDWTSLLVLMALAMVPELGVTTVAAGSLGNDTVLYVILCFMLASSLSKTGVTRRISIWFLTNKISRKSPWYTLFMIFVAIYLLSSVLTPGACVMVMLSMLYEIFTELGYQKNSGEALPSVVFLGLIVVTQIAHNATPISHPMILLGMSSFTAYTGGKIDFVQYIIVCMSISILCFIAWMLLVKFIWRPDVSRLKSLNFDNLAAKLGPMTKAEKWASGVYIVVIALWVLPGIMKYLLPAADIYFSKIALIYPPIIAIALLLHVNAEDGPILDFKEAVKAVPWGTMIFIGTIFMLGAAFSNKNIGLSVWLAKALAPVFGQISPVMFIIIMVSFASILTNFISNGVTIAICFAISMPFIISGVYKGLINPAVIAVLMTIGANYSWATPPATSPAAIVYDSGWLDTSIMFKWGMVMVLICILITILVGLPIANAILR